ncbi:MAG: hypothetical protein AB7J13_12280 [Pyrinomonadaceae bacterium]
MEILTREAVATAIMQIDDPEVQAEAAELALRLYGEAPQTARFAPYRFKPREYINHFLGWDPWKGEGPERPGQVEIIEAYRLALLQQFEKRDYEAGSLRKKDLKYWQPGQVIRNWIRMEAGHTVGKTKLEAGLISHFHDCFTPSAASLYAPTGDALRDNLWEELRMDRTGKDLPGRILGSIEIRTGPNHYIKGRATTNSHGKGTERIQGKHGEFLLFVLDEAEGIDNFVFDAIKSMTSGGITIVLMAANPKTRTSRFHKIKGNSNVKDFRISCLNHPNVVSGREIVPNAVQREYVRSMVEEHCEAVLGHNQDDLTFDLEWDVVAKDQTCPAGTIFRPDPEFCWRVLGIAPADVSDKTVIPIGRYIAAKERKEVIVLPEDAERATFGIDVARFGIDYGTLYVRWKNTVWREKQFFKQDSKEYFHSVRDLALKLADKGVKRIHIRIDAGGDSSGLIDTLKYNMELREKLFELSIVPVQFGGSAKDFSKYDNLVTEMYFQARETLNGIRIINAPESLEADLTLREWEPVNRSGRELKKLQDKKIFRKEIGRSPDDGDGFVLCVSPDSIFKGGSLPIPVAGQKTNDFQ